MLAAVSPLSRTLFLQFGRKLVKFKCNRRFINGSLRRLATLKPYWNDGFLDMDNQSVILPGPERIRASKLSDDPSKFVCKVAGSDVTTVYDVLEHGRKLSDDGGCLGTKNPSNGIYDWLKYSEVISRSQHIGSALIKLGLEPSSKSFVGAFATNRQEFILTLYACAGYSMVMVPLYDSIGVDNVNFIVSQANFPIIIVNSNKNALDVLKSISKSSTLKIMVLMDPVSPELTSAILFTGIKLMTFDEFEELGRSHKTPLVLPSPDDLFCIPYTSGTTGIPKGVMLTHKNVISCVASLVRAYGPAGIVGGTILSYLPPAHIYEIMNQIASAYYGRQIAFYSDDIKKIFDEIQSLKPSILPLVPRLMNAVYSKAMDQYQSKRWKHYLLKLGMVQKEKMIKKGRICNNSIWDKIVFRKFQDVLGGNLHAIFTTSAPVSRDVMKFFRCAAGCYIFEAYGQTEVVGGTMTLPYESDGGSVGAPFPCVHVKLVDVPEMNYFSKNDEGEICFRGPNCYQGYYKRPDETDASTDKDGWHHSGDIGRWLRNGTLQIIDRKKHLFKLSQGEYIAPEKVENAYIRSGLILQVYIDGLSDQNFVVALVVPEPNAFSTWAKKKKFSGPQEQLMQDKTVRTEFLKELQKCGKNEDLNSLEQAKNLHFLSEPFSVDNGLLTPTLKLRRNEARQKFDHLLRQLFTEGPLIKSLK